jgi:beta-glucanase (GH16 family)
VDSSGTWTGGWLEGTNLGHFVPPYYVEVRAQDPAVYGMWPAPGWTWSWPYGTTCGVEVDFAEMLGRWPTTVPQTVNGCPNPLDKHITTASPGISDWHVYSAAVYADHVDFYIDGTLTSTTYNTEVPGGGVNRTAPADLTTWLVPGACGSWADCPKSGTPDQQMYVDWIRAWVK